jgi:SAM-dependent methyltransferase
VPGDGFDYIHYHVSQASDLANAQGKRVLVVGCNEGREVSLFLDAGAREAWGIDVIDDVGAAYPREGAHYLQMSAEAMELDEDMFDIVFCLATMEHVACPEAAFPELSRVAAPEGFLYVVSAPLWNSRNGHHKGDIFDVDRYPWIHLRFDPETLKRMCKTGEIEYPEWIDDVAVEIDYMMSSEHFNKKAARDYVRICADLEGMVVDRNHFDLEPESVLDLLPADESAELVDRVGDPIELRAATHTLTAWKGRRPPRARSLRPWASTARTWLGDRVAKARARGFDHTRSAARHA